MTGERARSVRAAATALLVGLVVLPASGCVKIKYSEWIEVMPSQQSRQALSAPIRVDHLASYVEVASDGGMGATPSARYEREELLSAVAAGWNRGGAAGAGQPVRVIIMASLEHVASDTAGYVLTSILGVPALLGLPYTCAYSEVKLAIQSKGGATLFARGEGSTCSGLYYPRDHKMGALARGIDDAISRLKSVAAGELARHVPRVGEIPDLSVEGRSRLNDRVVWWVRPTKDFPKMWGEGE